MSQQPIPKLTELQTPWAGASWSSRPGAAAEFEVVGEFELTVEGSSGPAAHLVVDADRIGLERTAPQRTPLARRYEAGRVLGPDVPVRVIVDHGTVEVFADEGQTVLSMLTFAGPEWVAVSSGAEHVFELRCGTSDSDQTWPRRAE